MFLGRVQGHVVATAKDPGIHGRKLLVVEPLKVDYSHPGRAANGPAKVSEGDAGPPDAVEGAFSPTGRAIVAIDTLGAGEGQLVLIVQGSSARMADGCAKAPTDAVVIGIVDEANVMGRNIS